MGCLFVCFLPFFFNHSFYIPMSKRITKMIERNTNVLIYLLFIYYYIITQVILAFWLVLACDLWEDRRIDDDSARFKFFWSFWILNLNQSGIATNQFASFCMDIRSRQCYFRVWQSGEMWNKKAFFPYIVIFLL